MNKVAIIAAASAALGVVGLSAPASAQTAPTNWYANLGYTHFDTNRGDLGGVTGRVGYQFTPFIGAEGEASVGVNESNIGKLKDAWGVYGVGAIPVASNIGVFGRVGYQGMDIDGRHGATNQKTSGLGYGGGVQWHAANGFGVRGEYTRLQDSDADTWSVAGVLNF
jgi:hypothetical protein